MSAPDERGGVAGEEADAEEGVEERRARRLGDWLDRMGSGCAEKRDLRSGYCAGGVGAMDDAGDEGGARVAAGREGEEGSEGAAECR